MSELNNTGLLVSVELMLFCVGILIVLFVYSYRFISRNRFTTSRIILIVNLCYGFVIDCDIINAVYNYYPTRINEFYYAVNTVRYIMYIAAAVSWFLYCQREFKSKLFDKKIYIVLACIPAIILTANVLVSPFTGIVFSVSEAGMVKGPLYGVVQITAYIYIIAASLMAFIRMVRTNDKDERKRNMAIIIYAIPLVGSDMLQLITGYPFLCIGVDIALTMVFANLIIGVYYKNERKELIRKQRRDSLVSGLTEDYEGVFIVDVDRGTSKAVRIGKDFMALFEIPSSDEYDPSKVDDIKEAPFMAVMTAIINSYVAEEEREELLPKFEPEYAWQRLQSEMSFALSYRIIEKNGNDVYYRAKFVKLQDQDARRFILGFRNDDVTVRERMELEKLREEKAVQERTAELSSNLEAKTMFLFNMSHDIRTPMNAIVGFTNMAMKNIDDKEKALDALNKTMKSSDVLLALINQILDMSRIESGMVELSEDKADMNRFGNNVRPMLEELANDKQINFTFNIHDVADRYVYCDIVRVDEVLVNIVGNAIKYTQDGGEVQVDITQREAARDGYGTYEIKVADNGYGMSAEFQKHLFEDFAREETNIQKGIQGTGLGLPLCKKIVDLMNGTIDVKSEKNIGSTFTIIIPFKVRESDTDDIEVEYDESVEAKFVGKRILLAEDNELNREIAIDILSEDGFIVEEAVDGTEAVDKVRDKGDDYYDFVLMDIRMPYMDGYEATKQIRGFAKRHIPIIALSANAFEEDKAKSLKVGMDDHIAKPIEVDKLKRTLARFV